MSITDIGQEQAESTGGYEPFDVSGLPFVKTHPTTAVSGKPVALRYFPDNEDPSRGYIGVVVDDPEIYTEESGSLTKNTGDSDGQQIVKSTQSKGDDYKVVNTQDSVTSVIDNTGVDFDGNIFYGDPVDSFDEDRVVLKFSGGAGRSFASVLDAKGKGSADLERGDVEMIDGDLVRNDDVYRVDISTLLEEFDDLDDDMDVFDNDGTFVEEVQSVIDGADELPARQFELTEDGWPKNNRGLIERDDRRIVDDEYPRYQRDTVLRGDLAGEAEGFDDPARLAFLVQRLSDVRESYNGDAYWTTLLDLDGQLLDQGGEPADSVDWDSYLADAGADSTAELEAPLSVPPTDAFEVPDDLMAADYNGYLAWHYPDPDMDTLDEVRTDNGFDTVEETLDDEDDGTVSAD